jgi:ABC-type ATPase with predicted acetyltransferase domain
MRFKIYKGFELKPAKSERVTTLMRMFGVSIERFKNERTTHKAELEIEEGSVVYITGPSGAGKSVLLREIEASIPADERINIEQIELPKDRAAIDCINEKLLTITAMGYLTNSGLSDVFRMLTAPANLSEGEKYRFRLASSLASIDDLYGKSPTQVRFIFADEFCSNLDAITAAVISYNVRKFAMKNKVTFILASCREDILADLKPDVLVVKNFTGPAEVTYKKIKN